MQYLVSVINDSAEDATAQEMAAIDAFNDKLQAQGSWVFAGGLAAPEASTVIDNRAVAVAEIDGPEVALAAVDRLADQLTGYRAFLATRADLLRRLGRSAEARAAYDAAIAIGGNSAETAYLTCRRGQLAPADPASR